MPRKKGYRPMKSNTTVHKNHSAGPCIFFFFVLPAAVIFYWISIMQLVIKIKSRADAICHARFFKLNSDLINEMNGQNLHRNSTSKLKLKELKLLSVRSFKCHVSTNGLTQSKSISRIRCLALLFIKWEPPPYRLSLILIPDWSSSLPVINLMVTGQLHHSTWHQQNLGSCSHASFPTELTPPFVP